MIPTEIIPRFAEDLDRLVPRGERVGLAVSGGPDSMALLLLASEARPNLVEAITVDHGLRPEAGAEAAFVADLCSRLSVPHSVRTVEWQEKPSTGVQERARDARYALIGDWMAERGIGIVCTAHHLDDQAETMLMRLARGSGVRGLAAMRPIAPLPGAPDKLIARPLLGWRRHELEAVCASAGVTPVADPSNDDRQYERVRVRKALSDLELDASAMARSAANLGAADKAIEWAVDQQMAAQVRRSGETIAYDPGDAPAEVRRRVVTRIIAELASEGPAGLRGQELDRLLGALASGEVSTLRGVRAEGGNEWRFSSAKGRILGCG